MRELKITFRTDMVGVGVEKVQKLKMSLPKIRPDFFLDEGSWSKCGYPLPLSVSFILPP